MTNIRQIENDGVYHVYNRGTLAIDLFRDPSDYHKFMTKIYELNLKCKIDTIAFCLMPNHFHLIMRETNEQIKKNMSNISYFMMLLSTSYAKHFALKYKHSGNVMQGKFKCKTITTESYYEQIIEYVLNNPVRAGLVDDPNKWPYLSGTPQGSPTFPVSQPGRLAIADAP